MTALQSQSILSDYQRLKDWYLARLRQEAVERGAEHLTPAALVAADKALVEQLALAAATGSGSTPPGDTIASSMRSNSRLVTLLVVSSLLMPIVAVVLILSAPGEESSRSTALLIALGIFVVVQLFVIWRWRSTHQRSVDGMEKLAQSLSELSSRESLIADLSPRFLCLLDAEGKLLAWNVTFARHSGLQPSALYKQKLAQFLTPDTSDIFAANLEQARRTAIAMNVETGFNIAVGTDIASGPTAGPGGESRRDISWDIEWSQSTQSFFALGADVTSEKLIQRTRDEFVAMIGHDIRTPLAAVTANLQTLQDGIYGELNERAGECVDRSYKNARRLIGLISEMLDLEAARSGQLTLNRQQADIAYLVQEAVSECEDLAKKKSIAMVCRVDSVLVDIDAAKISRVLSNLIINAINYSPSDTTIEISTTKSTNYIEVQVKDQGEGIAADEQQLIFERYYRGKKHKDGARTPGTGLGLAICKTIIASHGGLMGVKSTPPNGSLFWFTLPLS